MTTATMERTTLTTDQGEKLILVSQHQRALPGEAGSDYKPVTVSEHLRRIGENGKETSYKTNYSWKLGEMGADLVNAMAHVVEIPYQELPTRDWRWTLKQATYVLSHRMRYDRKNKVWYRNSFVWDADVNKCMDKIDRVLARKAAKA